MTTNTLLEKLDNISLAVANPNLAEQVLDLLEQAKANGQLQQLVERYSDSYNLVLVRALSFLLAQTASQPTAQTVPLIYDFLARFKFADDPSCLINSLTAVQRQLIYDFSWQPANEPPPLLFPLINHALSQSVAVQSTAIALLSRMYQDGLLVTAFNDKQLTLLRSKLGGLLQLRNDLLDLELEGLAGFLNLKVL